MKRALAIGLVCATLVLTGCGGSAVSVRSNFSGPPVGSTTPLPATPGPNAPKGFFASGDGDVLLAVIVAMMVLDGLSWATDRIRQAFSGSSEAEPVPQNAPGTVERVARPPSYSWVFSRP